jgi:hypothetical protein
VSDGAKACSPNTPQKSFGSELASWCRILLQKP